MPRLNLKSTHPSFSTFFMILILTTLLPTTAHANGLIELSQLRNIVRTVATEIALSLSFPLVRNDGEGEGGGDEQVFAIPVGRSYDTSGSLRRIADAITGSMNSYSRNQTEFMGGIPVATLDGAYMEYINHVPTLAQALVARGRSWHSEDNRVVYDDIRNLSQIIYTYGSGLTSREMISTSSTIRTITASGDVVSAQDAWNMPGWLPGA